MSTKTVYQYIILIFQVLSGEEMVNRVEFL